MRDLLSSASHYLQRRGSALPEDASHQMAQSQALAYRCARDIASELQEGWTEIQAARLMDVYLRDCGVREFFHKSFAWFGERTRFGGMKRWRHFLPTARALKPGDCVILDTAPIYHGYPADIGYSLSLGESKAFESGRELLTQLRDFIQEMFNLWVHEGAPNGAEICREVEDRIRRSGFDVIHHRYPGAVLGHRVHPMSQGWRPPTFIPFGWQAVTRLLWEGVFPDLLNNSHRGSLFGAWAIEPHLGGDGFGCKFEEILWVDTKGARWISPDKPW